MGNENSNVTEVGGGVSNINHRKESWLASFLQIGLILQCLWMLKLFLGKIKKTQRYTLNFFFLLSLFVYFKFLSKFQFLNFFQETSSVTKTLYMCIFYYESWLKEETFTFREMSDEIHQERQRQKERLNPFSDLYLLCPEPQCWVAFWGPVPVE